MCYESEHLEGEGHLEFCLRMGWGEYLWQMLVADFLILNRDRHGANIEVLKNSRKRTIRLAPLFDHGLSFLCRSTQEQFTTFDVMQDLPCNNFIGSRSVWENLKLIPPEKLPRLNPLQESDREIIMEDLEGVIPQVLQDKIWDMIWRRW